MADSETSRTVPAAAHEKWWLDDPTQESVSPLVAPVDLICTTSDFLMARADKKNGLEVRRDGGAPTPIRILWKRWHGVRNERLRAGELRSALHAKILAETGNLPSVELRISGHSRPIIVDSLRGIKRLRGRLVPREMAAARVELRRRKSAWNEVASRFPYGQAEAEERRLAEHEAMLRRLLRGRRPVSLVEVTAKIHCLLATEDPNSLLTGIPWPELRVILDDLVHLGMLREARGERHE